MCRKTSEHIVAYIDMLGAKSRINGNQNESLNSLYGLYLRTLDGAKCFQIDVKFKIFSDNIVIARKLSPIGNEQRITEIEAVLWWCGVFCNQSVSDDFGWLCRGGITIGSFFIDNMMVWGGALDKVYKIESRIANYPRIVIDPAILLEVQSYKKTKGLIQKDSDDMYILNYMDMGPLTGKSASEGFEKMKSTAEVDEKIYKKLVWHKNYVNNGLEEVKDVLGDDGCRLKW
jgi:hypothetical protein